MTERFSRYDTAEYLKTEEDMVLYLDACLEDGDSVLTAHALGIIARARGINQSASDTGETIGGSASKPELTRENPLPSPP